MISGSTPCSMSEVSCKTIAFFYVSERDELLMRTLKEILSGYVYSFL